MVGVCPFLLDVPSRYLACVASPQPQNWSCAQYMLGCVEKRVGGIWEMSQHYNLFPESSLVDCSYGRSLVMYSS